MTLEEKAEEIANKRCKEQMCWGRCNIHKNHHCGYWHYNYECALKGIEYGLTEGRKEKWHDLRKNPNDLPTKSGHYLTDEGERIYDTDCKKWRTLMCMACWNFDWLDGYTEDIIAWCELPKFEE